MMNAEDGESVIKSGIDQGHQPQKRAKVKAQREKLEMSIV